MKKLILTAAAIAMLPSLAVANDYHNDQSRQPSRIEKFFGMGVKQHDTTRVETRMSAAEVANVQRILQNERYYRYAVDGNWGHETVSALVQFQRQHDLPATGRVDAKTAEELNKFGSHYKIFVNARDENVPAVRVKDVTAKVSAR